MNRINAYWVLIIFIPIILFLVGSLIYDHCQRGYLFTNRSSNETALIEQALERMPICNSYDRPRQRALLYTLQAWTELAHSNHIRYWISYRTLASYIQYHDLSPYDQDIDILIMAEDTPRLLALKEANYSSLFKLQVHPEWFITNVFNRSSIPSEGIDFHMQNARFMNQKNNVSINIWPMHINYSNKNTLMLTQYLNTYISVLSPIQWTFPLEPCVISNIRVWCPALPNRLIASIYEDKSIYLSCINGSWVNSNQ